MSELKPRRNIVAYIIVVWMAINILLLGSMIPGDTQDVNNYIEVALFATAIVGLLTFRKVGAGFATGVLCITLSTSMGNVLLGYYTNLLGEPFAYINALRIVVNAVLAAYMFRSIFANQFR